MINPSKHPLNTMPRRRIFSKLIIHFLVGSAKDEIPDAIRLTSFDLFFLAYLSDENFVDYN